MIPNHPLNRWHLKSKLLVLFVPLHVHLPLAIVVCVIVLEIHEKLELFGLAVEKSFAIKSHFVLAFLEAFVWCQ